MNNLHKRTCGWVIAGLCMAIMLYGLSACSMYAKPVSTETKKIPLPVIDQQPVRLRIAHVVNPRFKTVTDNQLARILDLTRSLAKQHLQLDVEFETVTTTTIEQFFHYLPDKIVRGRQDAILDFSRIDEAVRQRMITAIAETLEAHKENPQAVIDYASPFLTSRDDVANLQQLTERLVDTLITRMQHWYAYKAEDGEPVLDDTPFNQWVWWDSMGYGDMPYDVVITNQLVVSIEDYDMDVHSSLRGGITAGTMTYSKRSPYHGYVFVSVFQLLNDYPLLAELRNYENYSEKEQVRYAAALLAHELGHLFYHYGHPFNAAPCLMNPTPLLKYREWYEALNASDCRKLDLPMMQPGAANLQYYPHW